MSRPESHALGRVYRQMNALNRKVQQHELPTSIRLNDAGRLELCPDCDKKKILAIPKDPHAPR